MWCKYECIGSNGIFWRPCLISLSIGSNGIFWRQFLILRSPPPGVGIICFYPFCLIILSYHAVDMIILANIECFAHPMSANREHYLFRFISFEWSFDIKVIQWAVSFFPEDMHISIQKLTSAILLHLSTPFPPLLTAHACMRTWPVSTAPPGDGAPGRDAPRRSTYTWIFLARDCWPHPPRQ